MKNLGYGWQFFNITQNYMEYISGRLMSGTKG
jgi:hypothetical protein